MKRAVSITLHTDNLLWLKGQAAAATSGNISELIDRLVTEARQVGHAAAAGRSVVGTVDLPADEDLAGADAYVAALFDQSFRRPILVREGPPVKRRRTRG